MTRQEEMIIGILSWKVDELKRLLPDYLRNLNIREKNLIKSLIPSQMPDDYLSLNTEITNNYIEGLIEVIDQYKLSKK